MISDLPMSEAQWQALVLDLMRVYGWRVAHFKAVPVTVAGVTRTFTPVQADGAGFPDLCAVHRRHEAILYAELKTETGRVKPAQRAWLDDLLAAGSRGTYVVVLRPRDEMWLRRFLQDPHGTEGR